MSSTSHAATTDLVERLATACDTPDVASRVAALRAAFADAGIDASVELEDDGIHVDLPHAPEVTATCRALLRLAAERDEADRRTRALEERFTTNQRLSGVGSYDWHIASDTNRWTDELFRIYGEVPGSFEPSYEEFLKRIHPDDRERIQGIHQKAFEERGRYQMHERIVRPDGQVRILWSNGEVICDDDGNPIRMVGVCEDVTERVAAEERAREEREQLGAEGARRAAAMEINDNVVQGLTAVLWALDEDDNETARGAAERTLAAARRMLDRMLPTDGEELTPGDLRRAVAAPSVLGDRRPGGAR